MKKTIILGLILSCLTGVVIAQTITTRINKIDVDFNRNIATVDIGSGYYGNNNAWIPVGVDSVATIQEPAFDQVINELTQSNSLNMNAVINTLVSELNPSSQLTTNVNWDQVAILKSSGDNWETIKNIMNGVNWPLVSQLNGLSGVNWTNIPSSNFVNWPCAEAKGVNWGTYINANGAC